MRTQARKILAIIPARGGSKGVPGKNIRPIAGKPLINWTIERASASKLITRVIVSTDSEEIAGIAKTAGAEVPFLRPDNLAQDDSRTADVILHAIKFFEDLGECFDFVAILEPTSPLRKEGDIDQALEKLSDNDGFHSIVSIGEVHMEHPSIVKKLQDGCVRPYIENGPQIYQRQQADTAYFPYGVIYASTIESFKTFESPYTDKTLGFEIERWQNYEIDDEIDFEIAELLISKFIKYNG